MKIWFLGTGAGRPGKHRNVTGIALQLPDPSCHWWLFDAGEATQHQLLRTPLKLSKLEAVFVTHLHGDHLYGLPGLLSSRSFDGGITPLRLFGPPGLKHYVDTVFGISGTQLDYELHIHELTAPEGEIWDNGTVRIEAGALEHRIACYGYRVTEREQPGKLLVHKLEELGLTAGPLYGKLKQGQSVALEDGTLIRSEDVTGEAKPGRVVTILGDTKPCANVVKLAKGADLLVHEATFARGMEEKAHEFGHSTTAEAAEAAAAAGAKRLVMTHFSGRYGSEDLIRLEAEAAERFKPVTAAVDLMMLEVNRE
ncbi:ribonuclease Z [Paenibacillus arenilitoris]|uniref:Ribonuclease Z n=1 Tax=Paenibacillus arenilitoris TaxID=2772299 RepID=A0A927H5U0_9BACL|nr:ribonuclease Z [Paenibacillus arenilitoris]MBD2869821.1 ribonuclease Z [Paenibacillus arenilitoris]